MVDLRNMSADALDELSKQAAALAADLRGVQPSYDLALANGVRDCGYDTVRYGWVPSFSGEAEIVMADGRRWRAIGHRPRGSAEHVARNGWIEFVPCDPSESVPA